MKRRIIADLSALFIMAGSLGLVIITLSGSTRDVGIAISVASIVAQLLAIIVSKEEDQ